MIQQLLVAMLECHPHIKVVASAASVAEGISACLEHHPDLVILDLALPDGDGSIVARALQGIDPSAKVIVLSSFASSVDWPSELRNQVVAIIDKSRAYQDLINEIEALLPSDASSSSITSIRVGLLTRREREILSLIGRGYQSRQIAEQLCITLRTAETHRRNICHKFGISGAALIHQATLLHQIPPTTEKL